MYIWIQAFHVIFLVSWFAGLFYLPRLYVYHAMAEDRLSSERFKIMERKLYYTITTPAAALTMVLGLWLVGFQGLDWFKNAIWLHLKLVLVAMLVCYHCYLGYLMQQFANDANAHGHVFYRVLNELPVLFLILIVVLAYVKPVII